MDSILDGVGNLIGVGKSAAIEKENAKLKAENERIKKAFPDAVKIKVEELTQALVAEKQKAEAERDRALVAKPFTWHGKGQGGTAASGTASQ